MSSVQREIIPRKLNVMQNYEFGKCISIVNDGGKRKLCSTKVFEGCAYCQPCELKLRERIAARVDKKKNITL